MLTRPRRSPEWIWACGAAAILAFSGLTPWRDALAAAARGREVYLFLAGMMVLAEIARREGVFDWVAGQAVVAARGSRMRLFTLVFVVGTLVTAILSNDATAVVLTPAVAVAVRKSGAPPLPYLFACAFISNAASFILPISNPANLVVFQNAIPPLGRWLTAFGLPSLLAIGATYAALAWVSRDALRGGALSDQVAPSLGAGGRLALVGIALTAAASSIASARGADLGTVTAAGALLLLAVIGIADRRALTGIARNVSWSVLFLVAGLFVMVRAVEATGLLAAARGAAEAAARCPLWGGAFAAASVTALVSNLTNNLPSGLIAGTAVAGLRGHDVIKSATAIGIDLGPNLSVTGSLATVLWLAELRRQSIEIDALAFLRVGAIVMPPALLLAIGALCLGASHP